MWAAARCRAGLWGMPPLRSALTISSSSNQWICGHRAIQKVAPPLLTDTSPHFQTRRYFALHIEWRLTVIPE